MLLEVISMTLVFMVPNSIATMKKTVGKVINNDIKEFPKKYSYQLLLSPHPWSKKGIAPILPLFPIFRS